MAQSDSFISFIEVSRKLKLSESKLIQQWIKQWPSIFIKHNQVDLFANILMEGLNKHHANIPLELLQEMILISPPDTKINLIDSITQSEPTDESQPPSLLTLPTAIKTYTFQWLRESDLYTLQKTCRSICIDARDPDSLYHLEINAMNDQLNKYITYPRYSKIKSITFQIKERNSTNLDPFTGQIVPTHTFSHLQRVSVGYSHWYSDHEFITFLRLLYHLFSPNTLQKELQLNMPAQEFHGDRSEIILGKSYTDLLFDPQWYPLDVLVVENIKCIIVDDSWWAIKNVLFNLFATLETNPENDHKFEDIYLSLICSVPSKRDTPWHEWMANWDWDIIKMIPKHIKGQSELCLNASWWSEYRWREWIQQMFICFEGQKFFETLVIIMHQQIRLRFFRRLYGGLDLIDEIMKDWIDVSDDKWRSIGVKRIIVESSISCYIEQDFASEQTTIDVMLRPKLDEYKAMHDGFDFDLNDSSRPGSCKEVTLYVRLDRDLS